MWQLALAATIAPGAAAIRRITGQQMEELAQDELIEIIRSQ